MRTGRRRVVEPSVTYWRGTVWIGSVVRLKGLVKTVGRELVCGLCRGKKSVLHAMRRRNCRSRDYCRGRQRTVLRDVGGNLRVRGVAGKATAPHRAAKPTHHPDVSTSIRFSYGAVSRCEIRKYSTRLPVGVRTRDVLPLSPWDVYLTNCKCYASLLT